MGVTGQKKRFALDSNVLIDLGDEQEFAHRFIRRRREQGFAVPPTVIQELVLLASDTSHKASKAALNALTNMRKWEVMPFDLISCGHGITDENTRKLIARGLLPEEEYNDGLIIIETALACIPILVTSDIHLLGINPSKLTAALVEFDLSPIQIVHPKSLQSSPIQVAGSVVPKGKTGG